MSPESSQRAREPVAGIQRDPKPRTCARLQAPPGMQEEGPEDIWAMHRNASMHDHGASDEITHAGEARRSRDAGERVVQGLAKGRGGTAYPDPLHNGLH